MTLVDRPAVATDAATPAPRRDVTRVLAVVGVAYVAVFAVLAVLRLRYPYELEWMEGGVVDHVGRVLGGHGLYGPPSIRFTPYIYTPLYYYVAAAVAKVIGLGYAPLRLVSIAGALATLVAIGAWVETETGNRWAAVTGAGLFAACYRLGGAWFDLAREDSLMLALLFGGLVVARRARSPRAFAAAGALLALAVLTKQSALLPAVAVLPWAIHAGRRCAVAFGVTLAAVAGIPALMLQLTSHGWFSLYVLDLPAHHEIVHSVWTSFWTHDLLRPLAVACAAAVVVLARRWSTPAGRWFLLPVVAALGLTAYTSRLHSGGYDNVLLPAYGALAVLFGLAVADVATGGRWRGALTAVLAAQLALLAYNPAAQLPSAADRRGGDELLAALRSLHGSVYLPGHGWYLERSGHPVNAQGAAIEDVLRVPGARGRTELIAELRQAIDHEAFDYVVVDSGSGYSYLPSSFRKHYRTVGRLDTLARPVTGTITAPATVWAPIGAPS